VTSAALVLVVAAVVIVISLAGGESEGRAQLQRLGDSTTKAALVDALEGTGLEVHYRKVPHLEEYELVAGEARAGSVRLQFSIEIRRSGQFSEIRGDDESIPQPTIVRYGFEKEGEPVGNVRYNTVLQEPRGPGKEFVLESTKAALRMQIRFDLAIRELFAPKFRPGV
jgi:hypothetical protein